MLTLGGLLLRGKLVRLFNPLGLCTTLIIRLIPVACGRSEGAIGGAGVSGALVLPSHTLAAVELSEGMLFDTDVETDVTRLIGRAPPGLRGPIGRGDVVLAALPGEVTIGDLVVSLLSDFEGLDTGDRAVFVSTLREEGLESAAIDAGMGGGGIRSGISAGKYLAGVELGLVEVLGYDIGEEAGMYEGVYEER